MKAPWLTVTGKGAQGVCGTCGALFILAIVYDRPACPLCGAPDREQQAEAEAQRCAQCGLAWPCPNADLVRSHFPARGVRQ